MLLNHLVLAWRNIFRSKIFSLINIIGLSIGISCTLIVTVFVRYELSFDRHHEKSEKTYKVVQDTKMGDETFHWNTTAYPLAEALRNDFPQLEFVTQASGPASRLFKVEDRAGNAVRFEEPLVLFVDRFYPKVFDFHWLEGNPETALNDPNACVLTASAARKFFPKEGADNSILGKQIFLNNKDALTVTGLIEDALPTTSLQYTMLIPYEFFRRNNEYYASNWSGNYQGTTFIVLDEGTSPAMVEESLTSWKKRYLRAEDDARISYRLLPLADSHTNEKYGYAPQSYTMSKRILLASIGVGIFMLLTACVNFVNLSTAQAGGRMREVGIRKVMGSSRFGLIKQFFLENILLVMGSAVVAIAITQAALAGINTMLSNINLQLQLDVISALIVIFIGALVMGLSCLYPAIVIASYRPVEALKNKLLSGTGSLSLRRTLIVFQFAIVQVFAIGTLIIASQMYYLNNKGLGFSQDKPVLLANMMELDRMESFREELLRNPSIEEVCFSSSSPMSEYNYHYGTSFRLPGQREEEGKSAEEKGADLNYINFYDLKLVAGKNFSVMREKFDEFIVNDKLVYELGMTPEEAIGQRLIINEGEGTIVGVVENFHNNGLQDELTPCVLLNASPWLEKANIKFANGADLSSTQSFVEATWKKFYPEGVFNSTFLDDVVARNYTIERLIFKGFIILAILTVIIGSMGLYGLISFMTLRKTKEVGIRKTLGATVAQIVILFVKEFVLLICFAFLLSGPVSYLWLKEWLKGFAYHVDMAAWMFMLGVTLTLIITLLTVGYQSIKAALVNPVNALRTE